MKQRIIAMLRAPFIALLALLAGAAFSCSDTVPPPGATLSGFVYYDANANGVRDSCDGTQSVDQIATVRLSSLDGEGGVVEGFSRDGKWKIDEVPPGDYFLTLAQPFGDSYWLTTAPTADEGEPRYDLSLRGFESVSSLDFGVAFVRPITLSEGRFGLVTILFEDTDSDGKADPGDCLPGSPAGSGFDDAQSVRLKNDLTEAPTTAPVPYFQPGEEY